MRLWLSWLEHSTFNRVVTGSSPVRRTNRFPLGRHEPLGVSDNAIRKWCDSYNLPRKVSDIKKYTNEEWNEI